MKQFVRPWYCQELLPPSRGHVRHVKTKNKRQRNQIQECIKVFYNTFEECFLCLSHKLSVNDSEDCENNDEEE